MAGRRPTVKWSELVAVAGGALDDRRQPLALVQRDIKRMLAYSGIAHIGYLLLALVTLGPRRRWRRSLVYLLAYALMNAGAFAVVALLYARPGEQHLIADLVGLGLPLPAARRLPGRLHALARRHPADRRLPRQVPGLPQRRRRRAASALAVVGVLASLVGVFYYLRVVYVLYMKPETAPAGGAAARRLGPGGGGARRARHAGARHLALAGSCEWTLQATLPR